MTIEWPDQEWTELTATAILDGWRGRIARVEVEESEYLAQLPYVKGLAVIGSVGRGSPWPLSDIDLLAVADEWQDRDPEELIRQGEHRRNDRLHRQGIPNVIEPSEWVVLGRELADAASESGEAFLSRLEHPHWLGIVIKAEGGRAVYDPDGHVRAFLRRCNDTFYTDRLVQLWLHKVVTYCGKLLAAAEEHLQDGENMPASLDILRTTYQQLPAGAYAVWRKVAQSSARSVTRFLTAATEAQERTIQELYLAASRLEERTVWERFDTVPPEGRQMRDLMWEIRRGAGEELDELAVTRDTLNLSLWETVITRSSDGPRPAWTGATRDRGEVEAQLEAARAFLDWLREHVE